MKSTLLFSLIFMTALSLSAQENVTIFPEPVEMEVQSGAFVLTPQTQIVATHNTGHEAKMLNVYLEKLYGFQLPTTNKGKTGIVLELNKKDAKPESYDIQMSKNTLTLSSATNEGLFRGIQTILQLIPPQKYDQGAFSIDLPLVKIHDYPAFGYRGMHLDVGRHFFDTAYVKRYIDYLAMQKFNTFHWHLTEDQGWRIEIKKYPKLTSVGAWRNGTIIGFNPGTGNDNKRYGGFYTQDEIKDVVKYAQDRFITIIPEIELPGHSSAAIAAYPELSTFPSEPTEVRKGVTWSGPVDGKEVQQSWGIYPDIYFPSEYTFKFLENVLDEVIALFPSKYIHIGGDEAPKTKWNESDYAKTLIKAENLKDADGLQSYFIHRIEKYLNSKGRQIIGWDEILEGGLAPNATVMSWRGSKGGIAAAKQKHTVIMTPNSHLYFDYAQTHNKDSLVIGGFLPLEKVYDYNPIPEELTAEESKYILGAQANLWTEYISNPSKVEYMIFPRATALSEVLWTPKAKKDWNRFRSELPNIYKRYQIWGANYFKDSEDVIREMNK